MRLAPLVRATTTRIVRCDGTLGLQFSSHHLQYYNRPSGWPIPTNDKRIGLNKTYGAAG